MLNLGGSIQGFQGKKESTTEGGNERSSSRLILRRNGFTSTSTSGCSPMNQFDNNCKKTHVPSGSDRIRYKKLRAINRNYNDSNFGGDAHNASYTALNRVRR